MQPESCAQDYVIKVPLLYNERNGAKNCEIIKLHNKGKVLSFSRSNKNPLRNDYMGMYGKERMASKACE